jgi:hypothetical protein
LDNQGFRISGNFEQPVKNPEKVAYACGKLPMICLASRVLYAR